MTKFAIHRSFFAKRSGRVHRCLFRHQLNTLLAQSDVFGVKSKFFSMIRKIRLFRQGISEPAWRCPRKVMYTYLWTWSGLTQTNLSNRITFLTIWKPFMEILFVYSYLEFS